MAFIPGDMTNSRLKASLVRDEQSKGPTLHAFLDKNVKSINYSELFNKPVINGVTLDGELFGRDLGLLDVRFDTTDGWNAQPMLVSEDKILYVYTDYQTYVDEDETSYSIAGFKLGDGNAYLIDLPFLSTIYDMHIADEERHITQLEREFWNNKNRAYVEGETLIMTKY